jgi:hypothetical protein
MIARLAHSQQNSQQTCRKQAQQPSVREKILIHDSAKKRSHQEKEN